MKSDKKSKPKKIKEPDSLIEVDMSPQDLDTMQRNGFLEAQIVWKLTPKGIKSLEKSLSSRKNFKNKTLL